MLFRSTNRTELGIPLTSLGSGPHGFRTVARDEIIDLSDLRAELRSLREVNNALHACSWYSRWALNMTLEDLEVAQELLAELTHTLNELYAQLGVSSGRSPRAM